MINRKASTQLKLPITINRSLGQRGRAETSEVKNNNEKNSIRQSVLSEKQIQNEVRSESPTKFQKEPPMETIPEQKPELTREKSINRPELKKSKSQVKRELNEILGEDKMKTSKERRMAEKIERERIERDEREAEEKRQQYLEEEHRRWKIKDKIDSKGGRTKRTVCGRLFLQVGETSEFDENNIQDQKNENEAVNVIQGTLAAELLELIEKSRGVRPVEVQRQNSKDDKKDINSPRGTNNKELTLDTTESKTSIHDNNNNHNNNNEENNENKNNEDNNGTKQNERRESDDRSSFDEEEYFREIAALSFETGGGEQQTASNPNLRALGKVTQPTFILVFVRKKNYYYYLGSISTPR